MNLNSILSHIKTPSFYVIDIGASTGVDSDPVFNFIVDKKYRGLCIEGKSQNVNILRTKTHFDIHDGYVTPSNVLTLFENYNVPYDLDILKIDIDGYDLEVLRVILSKYNPKIIIAEINEKIPPPICFEVKYKENYSWDYSHCFGFSIQAGAKVLNDNKYKIVSIYELNNILCVNADLCKSLEIECINTDEFIKQLYKTEYIDNYNRFHILPWNENVNYWLSINDNEVLKNEISNYFVYNNNRSQFEVKTKIKDIDFTVEYF
jgi:hypothetical protein